MSAQQKTPCKYFVLYGNCRYGDACRFFHPPTPVKGQQPVAVGVQQKINGPLASKRIINTAGDTKITITSSANEAIVGKRKRILATTKEQGAQTFGKQIHGQTRQQPQQKKIKNTDKAEENSGVLPSMARTTTLQKPATTRRVIRRPPSDSPSTSPDSSPMSSSVVSPLSSPPSSPSRSYALPQLIQPTLVGFSKMVAETKAKGDEHSRLYGGYSWDKSGAGRVSTQQQDYTLNLKADGTWDLHEDSIATPSAFAVAFGSFSMPKRKRTSLGGAYKFLPATEEDKRKNVFWIEMTKTKESVQEEGLVNETTTKPATLRVPYQISTTQPHKVGILMNAFGKEQLLLVKCL